MVIIIHDIVCDDVFDFVFDVVCDSLWYPVKVTILNLKESTVSTS